MNFIFNIFVVEILTKFYKTLWEIFNITNFEYGQPVVRNLKIMFLREGTGAKYGVVRGHV